MDRAGDCSNALCPSVSPSVRPSVTFRLRTITNVCIAGLTILLGTNVLLIETMCSDLNLDPYLKGLDSDPYLKVQGHMTHLKVRVHVLVSAL